MNHTPPTATKKPHELVKHDHKRIDDYFWLNDREDQEVLDYLNAENEYTKQVLAHTTSFQEKLYDEIVGRIKQTDESLPYFDNGFWYYTRYEEGKEYPIYCRKETTLENDEIILLDVNQLAKGHEFCAVTGLSVSENNQYLSYAIDTVGRNLFMVHVKDLHTGETLADAFPSAWGGSTWANDNKTIFYAVKDETLRACAIKKHVLGTPETDDKVVFEEKDATFGVGVGKTKSKEFLMIMSYSTLSTECQVLDANTPEGTFKVVEPRGEEHEYSIDHYGDKFYIVTNWNAQNFRLMETGINSTTKDQWTEVIAHRDDVLLEGVEIFKDQMVVEERSNGLTQLRIRPWKGDSEYYLDFGEEAYTAYVSVNPDFNTNILRYGYTSLTTPNSTFDFNMVTKEKELKKQQEVIDANFDPRNYETKRLYATASDGTQIPMSIVYKKGIKMNGSNPTLLYGYGSYGVTIDPSFRSNRLSLLDRGFVFAIAHIRGSEMLGRAWYEDGKMMQKKNTFTDFIACGEYLVEEGYTSSDHLCAMGGSAGGLLMGAVVNMKPELWKGVIAAVPFVDVISTMLDESIPLTTGEYDEWGNPNEKAAYEYILSYSPYDNVEAKAYPNMLVTTGLHDSQVQYWEPAKWVAKLRELKTDNNMLLLHTNMDAGHGGATGRFKQYKETAMEYAFLLNLMGINE